MKKRIVVKVGSNVLTTDRGKLDITRVSALVDQIAWLREQNYDVVLVTSGAVACGRGELQVDHSLDSVEQRQLFSAMGQVKLINLYYDLFREYNIHVGQVLTTKDVHGQRRAVWPHCQDGGSRNAYLAHRSGWPVQRQSSRVWKRSDSSGKAG